MRDISAAFGSEAILPVSYGGSNGLLTQDTTDATFFRRLGRIAAVAHGVRRADRCRQSGSLRQDGVGQLPGLSRSAELIVLWGVNPGHSGIHIMPFLKQARERGAQADRHRSARDQPSPRQADLFLQIRPGTDLAVALAVHRHLFETGRADEAFSMRSHDRRRAAARKGRAVDVRTRRARSAGFRSSSCERFAEIYATTSPALVKCGWGLERNRNGGSAAAAVLALPAVAGKFGVRGGGYSMSNSASWNITRTWVRDPEADTRAINMNHLGRALLGESSGPPVKLLFVYNCNPAVTMPDQRRVLKGLEREDLFTVVFDQVLTDTALYADVVLPATTFLEHYDFVKSYGPITLQLARPVIDQVGESRPNAEVFAELIRRLDLEREGDPARRARDDARRARSTPRAARRRAATALESHGAVRRPAGAVRGRDAADAGSARSTSFRRSSIAGAARTVWIPARPGHGPLSPRADFAGQRTDRELDARRAAATRGGARHAPSRRRGARSSGQRGRADVQRAGRGAAARACHAARASKARSRCRKASGGVTSPTD